MRARAAIYVRRETGERLVRFASEREARDRLARRLRALRRAGSYEIERHHGRDDVPSAFVVSAGGRWRATYQLGVPS